MKGPAQGHYFVNPDTAEVEKATSAYERPQPHACQPFHAPVSTPFGPVAIGSIVEGGLVGLEVFDGTHGGRGTTRVVAVAENGVKPVFRVILKNGAALEATGDHLVLASHGRREEPRWVPVEELSAGMRLRMATASEVRDQEEADQGRSDEAALVGWLHGDGFVGQYESSTNRSLYGEPLRGFVDRHHLLDSPAERTLREETILRLEFAGLQQVYDIQTLSGQYLSNNIVVHNCFILSIEDDLVNEGGIMDLITREARLFKYGSGTGTNYSKLAPPASRCRGGGVSSGLLSFLKVSDRSASSIKSGGTTRRAARMVTLDADHPDVFRYIDWKAEEERKVAAMVTGSKILQPAHEAHPGSLPASSRERRERGRGRGPRSPQEQGTGARRTRGPPGRGARLLGAPGDPARRAGRLGLRAGGVHDGLGQRGVQHGERPVVQQLAAPHRHLHAGGAGRRLVGAGQPHGQQDPPEGEGAGDLGADRHRRVAVRGPRAAVPHHDQRLAHLSRRTARSARPIPAPSTCSSTTRRATSPRSTS